MFRRAIRPVRIAATAAAARKMHPPRTCPEIASGEIQALRKEVVALHATIKQAHEWDQKQVTELRTEMKDLLKDTGPGGMPYAVAGIAIGSIAAMAVF